MGIILHSHCRSGILYQRRQLLLPSINTEEWRNFSWTRRKEKSSKVQFNDIFVVCFQVLFHQSLSLSFLFNIVFVVWLSQPCFLVIAFVIRVHASSFPFSLVPIFFCLNPTRFYQLWYARLLSVFSTQFIPNTLPLFVSIFQHMVFIRILMSLL